MNPILVPEDRWLSLPVKERKRLALKHLRSKEPKVDKTPAEVGRGRDSRILRKYGMTKAQWRNLFHEQGLRCGICKRPTPGSKYGWATDHCHRRGHVRGILCHGCNIGLGAFKDDISSLEAAIKYLRSMR